MTKILSRRAMLSAIVIAAVLSAGGCKKKPKDGDGEPNPSPGHSSTPVPSYRTDLPGVCAQIPDGTATPSTCELVPSLYVGDLNYVQDRLPKNLLNGAAVIRDIKNYTDALISGLSERGYCGVWDGHRLFVRKQGEFFTEQFQLAQANGVQISLPQYEHTCDPATPFPNPAYPEDWYNSDPECPLPAQDPGVADNVDYQFPVEESQSQFVGDVTDARQAVIDEERRNPTGMLDFNQTPAANGRSYLIPSREQNWIYLEKIRREMRRRGYCSARDNDYIAFKKDSNDFSENYDFVHRKTVDGVEKAYTWMKFHGIATPSDF